MGKYTTAPLLLTYAFERFIQRFSGYCGEAEYHETNCQVPATEGAEPNIQVNGRYYGHLRTFIEGVYNPRKRRTHMCVKSE